MVNFLDYHKNENGDIDLVGVMTENGLFKAYYDYNFDDVLQYLMGSEIIIVFGKTRKKLIELLDPQGFLLADENLENRWIDLGKEIYKSIEERTTLRQVAKGTLNENIQRIGKETTDEGLMEVEQQIETNLEKLREIYQVIETTGVVSFEKKDTVQWVDLEINENVD